MLGILLTVPGRVQDHVRTFFSSVLCIFLGLASNHCGMYLIKFMLAGTIHQKSIVSSARVGEVW